MFRAAINTERAAIGDPLSDLGQMLENLVPLRRPGIWVYAILPDRMRVPESTAAIVNEMEGSTIVLRDDDAESLGLRPLYRVAWITLHVHSALSSVGLTAAVSAALTREAIPCNVLAGCYHDHILVPDSRAGDALACLHQLQCARP